MNKVLSLQALQAENTVSEAAASTVSLQCSTYSILCDVKIPITITIILF